MNDFFKQFDEFLKLAENAFTYEKIFDLSGVTDTLEKMYITPKNIRFDINEIFRCGVPELNTKVVLLLNGWYYDRKNLIEEFPDGVIIGSFQKAAEVYPDIIEKHFAKYADSENDGMVALNTAFV